VVPSRQCHTFTLMSAPADNTGNRKVAIVTGASRGIGSAIAERLASDGFAVVINYSGNEKAAATVAERIKAKGGSAIIAQADVSKPADVTRMFDTAEKEFGGVDVLVNNAGVMILSKIAETADSVFDQQLSINLKGTFNGLREAAKRLRSGGRIISASSSVVALKFETYGVYTATKAAVEVLTAILSKELRGRSITVNAIAPGPTGTELFVKDKSAELIEHFAKMNPLERLGTPQDIAGVVSFLAGPDGGWINGQVIRANGGMI
jgi:3-oxoacyl-[acyl-carrier protein] reductase